MNWIKLVFWLRTILLMVVCFQLVSAKLFIEAGVIAMFVLTGLNRSRIRDIEKELEGLK